MQKFKKTLAVIAIHSELYMMFMMNNQHLIVTLVPAIMQ